MSTLLKHITDDFDHRMALRRRMLTHLDISFTDDDAQTLRSDIRETLLACSNCPNPHLCESWLDDKTPGLPMFCKGREALQRLEAAVAAPAMQCVPHEEESMERLAS